MNLISNALKYTQLREPAVIEIGQVSRDGVPVVFVRDNGVGFNMKYADIIRCLPTPASPGGIRGYGHGAGHREENHGETRGRIWAEAELNKGATFYFTLAGRREGEPQGETFLPARQKVG